MGQDEFVLAHIADKGNQGVFNKERIRVSRKAVNNSYFEEGFAGGVKVTKEDVDFIVVKRFFVIIVVSDQEVLTLLFSGEPSILFDEVVHSVAIILLCRCRVGWLLGDASL